MTAALAAGPAVPFLDLQAVNVALEAELTAAAQAVITSSRVLLGPRLEAFEADFASVVGARFGVGVGSGLDALALALRAVGVEPGDEVLVPSHTFVATWLAVLQCGALPVPVEPRSGRFVPSGEDFAEAIGPRTRAAVPVHLHGHGVDLRPLMAAARERGVRVVDDAAQAHGARCGGVPVGALADATAWSFYPGKNLGAIGDGGAVTTSDEAVAARVRRLRNYGSVEKYVHVEAGVNSRLDELQAALLSVKLAHLDAHNERRRAIAARYSAELRGCDLVLPATPAGDEPVWHLYVVRSERRDALRAGLAERGVETQLHYPIPPHRQEALAPFGPFGALPEAERIASEVLSLPIGPAMTDLQVDRVVDAVRDLA